MWIADNLSEARVDGQVHYFSGLRPLDVDEGIVEQGKFMSPHIIQKAELKNVSACVLKLALLFEVPHCGNGGTHQTDEPPVEFQKMLREFQGVFRKPTFANSWN